jgi:N4-(beta-N-acetylglucosaminyl)-L-asparaginase
MKPLNRRTFIGGSVIAAGAVAARQASGNAQPAPASRPIVISSANGLLATERAAQTMQRGGSPVEAVVAGVNIVEEDPKDMTVGYGGLPNEAGVVELDASIMDGRTGGAGAVAALQGVKTPSRVARLVMERTDHVMLVGDGAQRFAVAHGFVVENLLTEESRRVWLEWLERRGRDDDWGPSEFDAEPGTAPKPTASSGVPATRPHPYVLNPPTGTITCLGLDARGDLAGTTTTSGLAFKIPGRVGDSPLIGCGLYVDNEVGAAGSTGRGEEVIKINGARIVVENMRRGLAPLEACLDALQRIVDRYRGKGKPAWDVFFYALAKDGRHAAASIWDASGTPPKMQRSQYAVFDGNGNSLRDCGYLFKRQS